jgi:sec-independent protein translocase protein TatB
VFGIGLPEFLLIIAVAVMVIGPRDLPRVLYTAGKMMRKFKMITADLQKSLDNVMKEGELEEITREANKPGGVNLQFAIERQVAEEETRKNSANG